MVNISMKKVKYNALYHTSVALKSLIWKNTI